VISMSKFDRTSQSASPAGSLTLEQMREKHVHSLMDRYSFADLWYSFGTQYPGAVTLHNFPQSLQNIMYPHRKFPFVKALDLATVDIIRDRERGVPRYNEFRRLLNMPPLSRFEDFYLAAGEARQLSPEEQADVNELKSLYNNDLEKVDLLVGSLAESVRPDGFGFGETAFQIFVLMASRRLMTDRFFSEDFTAAAYTELGIKWVNDATFKAVLERHVPELAPILAGVEQGNAFKPWPRGI
jgi:Animal haem peroxidase